MPSNRSPGPVFVEDDELTLRTIEEDDHDLLYANENEPAIRRDLGRTTVLDLDTIEEMLGSDSSTAFLPCVDGDPVGYVWLWGIDEDHGHGELGYWILSGEQGKGYATEAVTLLTEYAFAERRFHRVQARAWETNEASQRVLEKTGFEREGTLREHAYVDGEHLDAYLYGRLVSD